MFMRSEENLTEATLINPKDISGGKAQRLHTVRELIRQKNLFPYRETRVGRPTFSLATIRTYNSKNNSQRENEIYRFVTMVTMVAVVEIQGVKILTPPFFFSFFSF
jgi:hypothetical protein